jgi:hypothetical protein
MQIMIEFILKYNLIINFMTTQTMGKIKELATMDEDYFLNFCTKEYTNCAIFLFQICQEHIFDEKGFDIIWEKYAKESTILFEIVWKHFITFFEDDSLELDAIRERKDIYLEIFKEWIDSVNED